MFNLKLLFNKKKILILIVLLLVFLFVAGGFFYDKSFKDESFAEIPNEVLKERESFNKNFDSGEDLVEPKEFSFAVLGDSQIKKDENLDDLREIMNKVEEKKVDFVVSTGDNISSCDEKKECKGKIADFKKNLGNYSGKFFTALGNHDLDKKTEYWTSAFEFPANGPENLKELVYSFDYGAVHLVFLSSDFPHEHRIDDEQLMWLEKDLAQNKKPRVLVFFHEPAFPVSSKKDESLDMEKNQRDKLWKILDNYKVSAVFSGHEHLHSRRKIDSQVFPEAKSAVYQFIVGNTSSFDHDEPKKKRDGVELIYDEKDFLVVKVKEKEISVLLFNQEGKVVDEFRLP